MRRVVSGPAANLKLVRKLKRDWLAAVRREEQCDDVTQAWRFAARSDRAARALAAAQDGVELQPVFVTKRVRARAALGVLAQLGRSIARSVRAAAALAKAAAVNAARRAARLTSSSLRRALARVAQLISKGAHMIRYVRIVTTERKRFILRVTKETARFITGIEVDGDGEEVVPPGYHNRLRVIERTAIKKLDEMRMNNTYATLEVMS